MATTSPPRGRHHESTGAAATVRSLHRRLAARGSALPIRLWTGEELGPADRGFRLVLRQPWSLRSMLLPPTDLAAGEAYLCDDIDVEGSMVAAIEAVAGLREEGLSLLDKAAAATALLSLPRPPSRGSPSRRARLLGQPHSVERDTAAIRFHYDVGNDFYRLFLDRNLVYSCAYFAAEDADAPPTDRSVLDRAQERKLELICRKLRLRPGDRMLDIGCGWGSLVLHAARHHGARVLGVTLAEEQAALGREQIAKAGLEDRAEIRIADYREVTGSFDAIASIGMVEHVGADTLPVYFQQIWDLLAPGGRLLNHGITTGRRDEIRDLSAARGSFVGAYVFPDGALVPAHHMIRLVQQTGFDLLDVEQLQPHYARTLRHWVANLEANAAEARHLVGDPTYRIWRAYMAGSAVGFDHRDLGVIQILAGKDAEVPFGRSWMLPHTADEESSSRAA